jgi:hypothetical protein
MKPPSTASRHFFFKLLLPLLTVFVCIGTTGMVRIVKASSEESVMKVIEYARTPYDNDSVETAFPISRETVPALERYQGGTFRVLARKKEINRYPCNACHDGKRVEAREGALLTHGDISLNHGQANALSCIDCHSEEKRDALEDKKGNTIDFDHSYQLCGQCHFRQKSDWLGGAHGKRVSNWTGERVIYNCTTCHDPHSPLFEKRLPATFSPQSP